MQCSIKLQGGRLLCRIHDLTCVNYRLQDRDEGPDLAYQPSAEVPTASVPGDLYQNAPIIEDEPTPIPTQDCFRGTGRVLASKFVPPSPTSTPAEVFPAGTSRRTDPHVYRFINRNNPDQFLIYTDGACLRNGQTDPSAGWAFVFKPSTICKSGTVSGRLEYYGPFNDHYAQTNNRAELRAVLAALRFRSWADEGFTTLVVATDFEYVAKGATEWAYQWVRNLWMSSHNEEVKNRDLWELLLEEFERLSEGGVKVEFWRIPREMNEVADRAAKQAAEFEGQGRFYDMMDTSF
ncbi:hypothetical protein CEP54_010858 [Fusarium duplospermum]|uniref:ribonuclease H n=1 Tax=Fusarium duplospermum TaxID=1325734 RepID=A0A428PHH0_9HYPO|nr:hypothetical protein CEP54_010858 [Fusarium duplospermum]